MRTTLCLVASVVVLAAASPVAAQAAPVPSSTAPSASATAVFYRNLVGVSRFTQTGSSITVNGLYARLTPNTSYFTVIYGNTTCDPAQAFPVGYFTTDTRGRAAFAKTVPATVPVSGTLSVSVRYADTAADLDQDGLTGPTDVVAVAGSPSIGLVECNSAPRVRS